MALSKFEDFYGWISGQALMLIIHFSAWYNAGKLIFSIAQLVTPGWSIEIGEFTHRSANVLHVVDMDNVERCL
jgi:hypothetical protein